MKFYGNLIIPWKWLRIMMGIRHHDRWIRHHDRWIYSCLFWSRIMMFVFGAHHGEYHHGDVPPKHVDILGNSHWLLVGRLNLVFISLPNGMALRTCAETCQTHTLECHKTGTRTKNTILKPYECHENTYGLDVSKFGLRDSLLGLLFALISMIVVMQMLPLHFFIIIIIYHCK